MPIFLAAVTLAYLLGSIPIGFIVARARGIDLRKVGSGNVGATNAGRALGKRIGIAVFAGDALKGLIPTILAGWVDERSGVALSTDGVALSLGVAAILGHVFPVWLRFQGGKGVATSAGVCAGLHWQTVLVVIVLWYLVLRLTRYVSVASMVAACAAPFAFVAGVGLDAALGERRAVTAFLAALAVLILVLHRKNIARLVRGQEHRVGTAPSGEKT